MAASSKSSQTSQSATTTYSNSFNKSYSLDNVGNVVFGDAALQSLAAGNDPLTRFLPWALALVAALVLLSIFRGDK